MIQSESDDREAETAPPDCRPYGLDHSRRLMTDFALLDAVHYRGLTGQIVGMAIERDRIVYDVRIYGQLHRVAGGAGLLTLAEPLAAGPHLARPVRGAG